MRLIDADKLMTDVLCLTNTESNSRFVEQLTSLIADAPTVALYGRKEGMWILDPDGMDWGIPAWICSVCRSRNDGLPTGEDITPENIMRWSGSKFCPHCGAKMLKGAHRIYPHVNGVF